MKELGPFDPNLEMFVDKKRDFKSMNHIRELRWRAEQGLFGPKPLSMPRGELLFRLSDGEIKEYALREADKLPVQALRQHLAANGDY